MAKILYGAPVKEDIKKSLLDRVSKITEPLSLAVFQVGDRSDSNVYIENKRKFGKEIGVDVLIKKFDTEITSDVLIESINEANQNISVKGIIVQLPLPPHLDFRKILTSIDPKKNADGLSGDMTKEEGLLVTPATARAVERLINFYSIEVKGRKVVVIGRSQLAGRPIAATLSSMGGEVVVCHRETTNTREICQSADIIISAAGTPYLVTKDFVKTGQIVIDVGINRTEDHKLVGDVDFEGVKDIVFAITPVPGGIGPLTVACLFENLLDLVSKSRV